MPPNPALLQGIGRAGLMSTYPHLGGFMKRFLSVSVVVDGALVTVLIPANGRDESKGTVCVTDEEIASALAEAEMPMAA
jgi:hypothetical protein